MLDVGRNRLHRLLDPSSSMPTGEGFPQLGTEFEGVAPGPASSGLQHPRLLLISRPPTQRVAPGAVNNAEARRASSTCWTCD